VTAPTLQTAERIEALDSLRGIAAMVVVFSHCCMMFPELSDYGLHFRMPPVDWNDPVGMLLIRTPLRVLWLGRGPVALFFVLSGFVLSLPWLRGRPPPYASYVVRRICRIYLPYLVAVATAVALAETLSGYRPGPQSEWFDTTNWIEPFTFDVALAHLFMLGTHDSFNNVIWSLVHEMRISLFFPLLLLPVLRFRILGATALVLTLIVVVMALTRLAQRAPAGELVIDETAATLQYSALFVMGATTAQYAARLRGWLASAPAWLAAGLPWLCLTVGLFMLGTQWPILPAYMQGLAGTLVIMAALPPGPIDRFLHRAAPRALGRISYSLYLIHLPLLLSMVFLLHGLLPKPWIILLVPPLAVPAAWAFNRLIEEPSARLGRSLARGMA
jgi:peptidoglycan/LPS O-acetylase OafA/YrhL